MKYNEVTSVDADVRHVESADNPNSLSARQNHGRLFPSRGDRGLASPAGIMMGVCCLLMVIGGGVFLYGGSQGDLSVTDVLWFGASVSLCLAMHVLMHRFVGAACHADAARKESGE